MIRLVPIVHGRFASALNDMVGRMSCGDSIAAFRGAASSAVIGFIASGATNINIPTSSPSSYRQIRCYRGNAGSVVERFPKLLEFLSHTR